MNVNKKNKMKTFTIKITGVGTIAEIMKALKGVIDSLPDISDSELENSPIMWEDATLFTEIHR